MSDAIQDKQITLTADHISKMFGVDGSLWISSFTTYCNKYSINTILRLSGFFGQIAVESGNLATLEENLNYSASGLLSTYPGKFNASTAASYARNPSAIANHVYANKIGNGNEASGDGWKYHGRGLMQITGKQNYSALDRSGYSCLSNPDKLLTKDGAVASACWFWYSHGLNVLSDMKNWNKITRVITGGYIALEKRMAATTRALQIFTGQAVPNIDPSRTTDMGQENTDPHAWGRIDQPDANRNSVYPYNWVFQSRSGHLIEIDDSPDHERLLVMHRSGSFVEFDPNGTSVRKSVMDAYEFTDGDFFNSIGGDRTEKVGSDTYTKAGGSISFDSDANINLKAAEQVRVYSPLLTFNERLVGKDSEVETIQVNQTADIKQLRANQATLSQVNMGTSNAVSTYTGTLQAGSISIGGGSDAGDSICDKLNIKTATIDTLNVNNIICHNPAQLIAMFAQQAGTAGGTGSVTIPSTIGAANTIPSVNVDTVTNNAAITNKIALTRPIQQDTYTTLPDASAYPYSSAIYNKPDGTTVMVISNGTTWTNADGTALT